MKRLCAAIVLLPAFTWCSAGQFDPAGVYDRLDRSRRYPGMIDPARTTTAAWTTITYTNFPPDLVPTLWTGANVRLDFGHTPLQRAPNLLQPAPPTNRPQAGTARVERAKESAQ